VSSGKVIIDESVISSMNEAELTRFRAKNIGIIFQNFQLIEHFTTLENVLLPLEVLKIDKAYEKAVEVLKVVGLGERLNHFPRQLSGGEKQRAAIARSYVTNPSLILADEPSGNLDPETAQQVMTLLFETARLRKQTVILVTHDRELAKKCDHIYEIKDHQIKKISS
jgi:putative ABC transport system ATP-binding protein